MKYRWICIIVFWCWAKLNLKGNLQL